MFGIQQGFESDLRLERGWSPQDHPRQHAFPERAPHLHNERAPPVIPDHDPINTTISRLSIEAVNELERVAEVGGLQQDDIKQSVWNILGFLRAVIREQSHRTGMGGVEPRETMRISPSLIGQAIQLNNSIMSIALDARNSIQNLATNAPIAEKRSILEGLQLTAKLRC